MVKCNEQKIINCPEVYDPKSGQNLNINSDNILLKIDKISSPFCTFHNLVMSVLLSYIFTPYKNRRRRIVAGKIVCTPPNYIRS